VKNLRYIVNYILAQHLNKYRTGKKKINVGGTNPLSETTGSVYRRTFIHIFETEPQENRRTGKKIIKQAPISQDDTTPKKSGIKTFGSKNACESDDVIRPRT
jgi:hypothetical protein